MVSNDVSKLETTEANSNGQTHATDEADLESCLYPTYVGDGVCHDVLNNYNCNFDGGDCCLSGASEPSDYCAVCLCIAPEESSCPSIENVGNFVCEDELNTPECHFDGLDCCWEPEYADFSTCEDCNCIMSTCAAW